MVKQDLQKIINLSNESEDLTNELNEDVNNNNKEKLEYSKPILFNNNYNSMHGSRITSTIQQEAIYAFQLQQHITQKHGPEKIFYRVFSSSSDLDYFDYESFIEKYKEFYPDAKLIYSGNFYFPQKIQKKKVNDNIAIHSKLKNDFLLNPTHSSSGDEEDETNSTRIIPYSQIIELADGIYFCLQRITNSNEEDDRDMGNLPSIYTRSYEFFVLDSIVNSEMPNLENFLNTFIHRSTKKGSKAFIVGRNSNGYTLAEFKISIAPDFQEDSEVFNLIYGDGFSEFSEEIIKRFDPNDNFENKNDMENTFRKTQPGILLLHGDPGTGKTTYIRYLVKELQERYERDTVFMTAEFFAAHINSPEFIEFFKENTESSEHPPIIVIEDAERIILSREDGMNSSSAVSTVLNMTDGLLRDALNVQIIATFNTSVDNVDEALLRSGRLLGRKMFKKISISRAKNLLDKLNITDSEKEELIKHFSTLSDLDEISITEIFSIIRKSKPLIHDFTEVQKTSMGFI
jgi:GTPase SAR1 family protein